MNAMRRGLVMGMSVMAVSGYVGKGAEQVGTKGAQTAPAHEDLLAGMDKPLPKEAAGTQTATTGPAKAPEVSPMTEERKVKVALADIATLDGAMANFEVETGRFPSTEEGIMALIKAPAGIKNWGGPYITKETMPLDPWGNEYQYRFPGQNNRRGFDMYAKGHEGVANNWSK